MKLAVATGLIGLGCCLSLHEGILEARRLPPQPVYLDTIDLFNSSLSMRNRNPLNVKGTQWQGQVGTDEQGHAIFCSVEYGIRAAAKVLRSYARRHGINTIEGIVKRFAEGNQKEYIIFLSKRLGLAPNEEFDILPRMTELLRHMSRFECGIALPEKFFVAYDILS